MYYRITKVINKRTKATTFKPEMLMETLSSKIKRGFWSGFQPYFAWTRIAPNGLTHETKGPNVCVCETYQDAVNLVSSYLYEDDEIFIDVTNKDQ